MFHNIAAIPEKKFKKITWAITIVVFILVSLIKNPAFPKPQSIPNFIYLLPLLNATLNGACFFLLLASLWSIKKGNVSAHRNLNTTAMILSMIFLLSYVVFHVLAPETIYGDSNKDHLVDDVEMRFLLVPRSVYLFILFSHIVLAALILPFILQTFYYGLNRMDDKHRAISRKIFPLWLYVAATGVIVYVLVSPYY
ncbi:MAG: DUF420 domain-containing protein [Bacteroidia bacterium]|nr:DUF420 domain-containing protein [Bacteroidia bacterium]